MNDIVYIGLTKYHYVATKYLGITPGVFLPFFLFTRHLEHPLYGCQVILVVNMSIKSWVVNSAPSNP